MNRERKIKMQNVDCSKNISCLVFKIDELETIIGRLFNDIVTISKYDYEFDVSFDTYEPDNWYDEIVEALSEYFGIEITSILINRPSVLIVYKDDVTNAEKHREALSNKAE